MSAPNVQDLATSFVTTVPSPALSGTTLGVTTGEGARFPAVPFDAIVHPPSELPTRDNAEKVTVTAIATDSFTITRAQGVTTAKAIAAGWRISAAVFGSHVTDAYARANHTGSQLLSTISDVTASAAELNLLDGATLSTAELNYVDGVTSAIQTQLDAKQSLDATLTALAGVTAAADKLIYATGADTFSTTDLTATARSLLDDASTATMRTTLGLVAAGAGDIWVEKAGDTMTGNLLIDDNHALNVDGSAVFNETGLAVNFRVESDNSANMLFVDGTNDRVGINTNAPAEQLHIVSPTTAGEDFATIRLTAGAAAFFQSASDAGYATMGTYTNHDFILSRNNSPQAQFTATEVIFNVDLNVYDFIVRGDTDFNLLQVSASGDTVQVGAGGTADSAKFYVNGKISTSGEMEINGALNHDGTTIGFYGTAPVTKPTVTGSRGGNAALASLLTALAGQGLLTDSSTA